MQTALRCTLVVLTFVATQLSFATEYTFTGNGSWTNLSNWKDGVYPGVQIKQGDVLNITGHAVMGICPTYPNPSCEDVYGINQGTINIAVNGSLTLQNQNQFSQAGVINVEGTLINRTVLQGHMGGTINVKGTFLNQIWFGNQGHLIIFDGGIVNNEIAEGITHQGGGGYGVFTNNFINPGKITIEAGGIINNKAPAVLTLGYVVNNGGTVNNFATLKGNPIITGNLYNAGTLAPGNSPGKYTIDGDYTATSTSIHNFEIEGTTAGTYDVLTATGTVNLSGVMNITLKTGVTISGNTEIPIITGVINGTFSTETLPEGLMLDYKANSVVLKVATALPVRFINLEAAQQNAGVVLSWKVADEKDVIRYEVEKSSEGNRFYKIGVELALSKDAYQFLDRTPNKVAYYRVKSIDSDGKYSYSPIVFLKGEANAVVLKAFFTASGKELIVQHPTVVEETKIYIHSLDGKLLKIVTAQNGSQQSTIAFPFTPTRLLVISLGNEKRIWETTKVYKP